MVKHKTYDEYLEILERFDIPLEKSWKKEEFIEELSERMGKYAPEDWEPWWEANQWRWYELAPAGARPVLVRYPWGEQLRFAIKGYRGLFGPEGVSRTLGIEW